MSQTTTTLAADNSGSVLDAKILTIVGLAQELEGTTGRYADLGEACADALCLATAAATKAADLAKLRKTTMDRIADSIKACGAYPDCNKWLKMHALVSLCPDAASLPKSAAERLLPLCRYDLVHNRAAYSAGYKDILPKLVAVAVDQKLTAAAVKDLVDTARKGQLSDAQKAAQAASLAANKAQKVREGFADALESVPAADLATIAKERDTLPDLLAALLDAADADTLAAVLNSVPNAVVARINDAIETITAPEAAAVA